VLALQEIDGEAADRDELGHVRLLLCGAWGGLSEAKPNRYFADLLGSLRSTHPTIVYL
jgi:hypothetical protein